MIIDAIMILFSIVMIVGLIKSFGTRDELLSDRSFLLGMAIMCAEPLISEYNIIGFGFVIYSILASIYLSFARGTALKDFVSNIRVLSEFLGLTLLLLIFAGAVYLVYLSNT